MAVAVNIVTGKTGTAHISGSDIRSFNRGVTGMDGALKEGRMFEATIGANNTISIADGEMVMQGVHWRIDENTNKSITIENGEGADLNRVDLILAHYHINTETGIESVELEVLKGNSTTGVASRKAFTKGDLRAGDSDCRMAVYAVNISGFTITSVVGMFDHIPQLADISGGVKVYIGSKVLDSGTTKTTSKKVLSDTEVKSIVGKNLTNDQLITNVFVNFMNGHYEANGAVICQAAERRASSNGYYVRFANAVEGAYRINYMLVCSV